MGHDEDDFVIAPDSDRRRWWLIAAGIAVLVLALGIGAWALFRGTDQRTPRSARPPAIEPAQPTSPSVPAEPTSTPPTSTTGSGDVTAAPDGGSMPGTSTILPGRVPYMAFRLNGTVYLARENGGRAIPLVTTNGVYALSPDARSLAYVDDRSRTLRIADLAAQTTRTVGPAMQVTPEWTPDSAAVLGVRDVSGGLGSAVFRTDRARGSTTVLGHGTRAAVSPDGMVVALVPSSAGEGSDVLTLLRNGRRWKDLKASAPIVDAVLSNDHAFVATTGEGGGDGSEAVWSLAFGGGERLVAGARKPSDPGDFDLLALSGNGVYLAYAFVGDDGRSRMSIARVSGGSPVDISPRRDVYPLWWAADSSAVFAIEGNSFQGEQTALVRVTPAGVKTVVVQGADR